MTVTNMHDNTPKLARLQLDDAEWYLTRALVLTATDAAEDGPHLDSDMYGEQMHCIVKALANVTGLRDDLHDVIGEDAA